MVSPLGKRYSTKGTVDTAMNTTSTQQEMTTSPNAALARTKQMNTAMITTVYKIWYVLCRRWVAKPRTRYGVKSTTRRSSCIMTRTTPSSRRRIALTAVKRSLPRVRTKMQRRSTSTWKASRPSRVKIQVLIVFTMVAGIFSKAHSDAGLA